MLMAAGFLQMSENTHDEIHPPNPTNKHAQKGHTTTGE
jgi:hypothetical protein